MLLLSVASYSHIYFSAYGHFPLIHSRQMTVYKSCFLHSRVELLLMNTFMRKWLLFHKILKEINYWYCFFYLKQFWLSLGKLLVWRPKWLCFLQYNIKRIEEEIQCYPPDISVISISIPAFLSHREQSLNLCYFSPCLIPETDNINNLSIVLLCGNMILTQMILSNWDFFSG